jgi:hypothetical protein
MRSLFLRTVYFSYLVIVGCFYACQKEPADLLYNQTMEQMRDLAREENKSFCIVLSNTDCPPCTSYIQELESRYKSLKKKAIFNIVNVSLSENQWYPQWICSMTTPTTCIFSPAGELQAIVSGAAKQCMDCIESSLNGKPACAGYFYSKYYQSQGDVIPVLNAVLESKLALDRGEYIGDKIAETFPQIQYPYTIYLKCISEQQQGNREEAARRAAQFLQFNSAYYYRLYGDLHSQARYILDPNYDPAQNAVLSVDKKRVLENCTLKQAQPFDITVLNTGMKTLEINDITLSCSCLKLLDGKKHSIDPGKSKSIGFEFTADAQGTLYREITLVSNASKALETVEITAIVK